MNGAEAPPPRVVAALAQMLPRDVRLEALTLRYGAQLEVYRLRPSWDSVLRDAERSPSSDLPR